MENRVLSCSLAKILFHVKERASSCIIYMYVQVLRNDKASRLCSADGYLHM